MANTMWAEAAEISVDPEARAKEEALYAATFKNIAEGGMVEGVVVAVQRDGVMVDVGYKSAGAIPREEFSSEVLEKIAPGDRMMVYLEDRENDNGNMVLSKEKADRMQLWSNIEAIYNSGTHVEGKILSKTKGGLIVDIGVKAFLPGSQIDLRPIRDIDAFIGKSFPMRVIKMDRRRGNIIVSRRIVLEESRDSRRKKTLLALKEGQVIEGTVKNLTEYGAFVDLGGIDGLLHITDMSWGRIGHPSEKFALGDKVTVVVLKYDRETGRISLGYKQQYPDPWDHVAAKYAIGTRTTGQVVSLTDYGAFVALEPGVEGLVHIHDMSWSHEVKHPSKLVTVGDTVNVITLNIDPKARKISLGMKQAQANPWDTIATRYPLGEKITGQVRNITEFGVFVGLEDGIDGLIHISDLSPSRHIKHPSDVVKKGQMVEAVVLKIDREKERISLGYKQLVSEQWAKEVAPKYPIGAQVTGQITKVTHFGLFVALEEGVEALVHISELGLPQGARTDEGFQVGQSLEAKVVRVDAAERKISLSVRALTQEIDRSAMAHFQSQQGQLDQSIGAVLKSTPNASTE